MGIRPVIINPIAQVVSGSLSAVIGIPSINSVIAPVYLFDSIPDSITVLASGLNGQLVSIDVNSEFWGSGTIASGVAVIPGQCTTLGTSANNVVATVSGKSGATTTNVKNVGEYFDALRGKTGDPVTDWEGQRGGITVSQTNAADQADDGGMYLDFDSTDHYDISTSLDAVNVNHNLVWAFNWDGVTNTALLRLNTSFVVQVLSSGVVRIQDGGSTITGTSSGFMTSGERILSLAFDEAGANECVVRAVESDGTVTEQTIGYAVGRSLANGGGLNDIFAAGQLSAFVQTSGSSIPYTSAERAALESVLGVRHFGWDPLV